MANIILIDDHKMMREGLNSFLSKEGWTVVGEAGSMDEAKKIVSEKKELLSGAIAIVDIKLGDESGFDVLKILAESHLGMRVLMYSMFDSPGYAMEAIERGAMGYITKAADNTELLKALDEIKSGNTYIQQSLVRGITVTANLVAGLTKKEKQVFDLVRQDISNEEISRQLNISLRTTENYVSKIYDKFGVNDRSELIVK
ncbi:MAG: response regulator transcription factor [Treponema sp.]|nr:response regulator transcription factor [Candidatus Treponema equifaecale]